MKSKKVMKIVCVAISCLIAFSSSFCVAEDRMYKSSINAKEGALTKKMLGKCIKLKQKLDKKMSGAIEEKDVIDELEAELTELSTAIEESQESLDQSDQAAIDAHNQQVEAFNAKKTEYDELVEAYNSTIAPYKTIVKKFEKQCKDQDYYEDDYEEVSKSLGYGL